MPWDAIVIGSGIGGLTFASIMAKMRGWRVLVLERHFKLGGYTHTFSRPGGPLGGWTWDVGVHYVGQMGEGMTGRRLFDFITNAGVAWNPMPDGYDEFWYPSLQFRTAKGESALREALATAFPEERADIGRYLRDVKSSMSWFARYVAANTSPAPIGWLLRGVNRLTESVPLGTTRQYLERRFRDPRLRAVVASQWGDYGLPPGRSAFVTHAVIANHYFDGAWYPDGGAGEIAKAAGDVIRAAGGDLLTNHEATRILLDGTAACGVEVNIRKGKQGSRAELRAPVIVSDAGAWNTFARLLPESFPLPFRDELASAPEGCEAVELFLGLKRDPRELGFRGENHWMFSSFDHDEIFARRDELLNGNAPMAYLSFPSLKYPQAGRHTAEVISWLSYGALKSFRAEPWRRRSPEYESAKQRIAKALLDMIERHHPGFGELVEYAELATPLTFEYFSGAPNGAIYGYPGVPDRYRKRWLQPRTPVRNLYLTGTDAASLGVMGALFGGVAAASPLLDPFGFFKIMRAAGVSLFA
jgi:all-trans-retinol 13,14-reductase